MILELWITLMAVSMVAVGFGYFTGDLQYAYVGFFFIFILGFLVMGNELEYKVGVNETVNYAYAGNLTQTTTSHTTYLYDSFTGSWARWFGFLIALVSGAGMSLMFFKWRTDWRDNP